MQGCAPATCSRPSASWESLAERYSTALGSPILIQTISTTYTNQEGRLVAIGRGTTISYGRRPEDAE